MPEIVDELLNAAQKHLGYREKSDGYTMFGDWYFTNVDKSDTYFKTAPWCDMFITWAATQAGVEQYVGEFAYTVDHAKWFRDKGAWSDTPEPGAIVFYDWSGSGDIGGIDHAGIVEKVAGDKIFTIEANVDKVWLKRKERDQSKVVGYGLPRKVQGDDEAPVAPSEDDGTSAAVVQQAAVQPSPPRPEPVTTTSAAPRLAATASDTFPHLLQDAATPASVLAAVLGTALIVTRVKAQRSPRPAPVTGRHRRSPGRHRAVMA